MLAAAQVARHANRPAGTVHDNDGVEAVGLARAAVILEGFACPESAFHDKYCASGTRYDCRIIYTLCATQHGHCAKATDLAIQHWSLTLTGKIRTLRVDKGFGFIKDDTGKEYFFHRSAVYGEGLENLREGDGVEFDLGEGPKGPRAENVRRTST